MPPTMTSDDVGTDWKEFVVCLDAALEKARRGFWRPQRAHLESWHRRVLHQLRDDEVVLALTEGWPSGEAAASPSGKATPALLLREELRSVTLMLAAVTGRTVDPPPIAPDIPPYRPIPPEYIPIPSYKPPPKPGHLKRLISRLVGLKDALKSSGTLVDSIKDLLEDAPDWLKALLTIAKEAIDTVAG